MSKAHQADGTLAVAREETTQSDELIAVAQLVKPRGLRGELVAILLTDFPERFDNLERLVAVRPTGERFTLLLEEHWFHAGRMVFKFTGYDSIEAAAGLVGCELAVPEAERVELGEDEFYDWQLTGCQVETIDGHSVGQVREVLHTGSASTLIIDGEAKDREHLVPLAAAICVEINIDRKLIRVDVPEGLLEL